MLRRLGATLKIAKRVSDPKALLVDSIKQFLAPFHCSVCLSSLFEQNPLPANNAKSLTTFSGLANLNTYSPVRFDGRVRG